MAKSARRMRRSARRMHRGGDAHLAPAPVDDMAAGPAGDAMTAQGPAAEVALVGDNQMPAADWKKKSMEELGFGAGDAGQAGGKKHSASTTSAVARSTLARPISVVARSTPVNTTSAVARSTLANITARGTKYKEQYHNVCFSS